MHRQVEPLAFDFGVDTQTNRQVDQFEQDQRGDRVIDGDDRDAIELRNHLMRIAVDQAALTFAAHPGYGQHAGQEGADGTADAMHAEDVKTVVIAKCALEPGGTPIAYDAGGYADDQGAARDRKSRCRSDRDQPGDRTRDNPEYTWLAFDGPLGD